MYRKSIISFFFLFAFFAVALSGYQCATNVTQDTGTIPINSEDRGRGVHSDNNQGDGYHYPEDYVSRVDRDDQYDRDSRLPAEPETNCPRSTYREWAKQWGEMAVFKIDRSSLQDYRLGKSLNFPINCARIFVDMNKVSGERTYKGMVTVAYDDGSSVKFQRYRSGFTKEENKYNRWSGSRSWKADRKGEIDDKEFHAIYEDKDAALILRIDYISEIDNEDGSKSHYASGELHYKMFRYSRSAGRDDRCFNDGTYMRYLDNKPPKRNRCWLLTTGPFSCRPEGVLEPRKRFRDIDITEDLDCYHRLGLFRNLYIKGAFNVSNIRDI